MFQSGCNLARADASAVLSLNKSVINFTGNYGRVANLYRTLSISLAVSNSGTGTLNWSMAGNNNEMAKYLVATATGSVTCETRSQYNVACSGAGASILTLNFTSWWSKLWVPGDYSTVITFTNTDTGATTDVPVNLHVVAKDITPVFSYLPSYPVGCYNTNGAFGTDPDTCVITNERPTSTAFSVPGVGGTYTDPNLGGTVRVLTPPKWTHAYSSLSPMNSDDTMVMVYDSTTFHYNVINATTGAIVEGNVPGNDIWNLWSSVYPNVYYYHVSTALYKHTVGGANTLIRDFAPELGAGNSPNTGGQADLGRGDWLPFYNTTVKKVCAYDIPNNKLYCADYSGISPTITPNYILISRGVDATSHKRYVILAGLPADFIFTVNEATGALDLEYVAGNELGIPTTPLTDWDPNAGCLTTGGAACVSNLHDDTVQDENGIQYLVQGPYYNSPNAQGIVAYQLNKNSLMTLPKELGGGMHVLYWHQPGSGVSTMTMIHIGCARWAPYCLITTGRANPNTTYYQITGATNDANIKITTQTANTYVVGDSVNIGGVLGNTAANGVWTVQSVINSTNFTINANGTSSGTFTSGGVVEKADGMQPTKTYQGEVIVFKVGVNNPDFHRLAFHRSLNLSISDYYAYPRGAISQDASQVIYDTNFGEPTQYRVATVGTGLSGYATTDLTAPTASIVSPTEGSTIYGNTSITASAFDDVGVVGVKFYYDSTNLIGSEVATPISPTIYTTSFDITSLANGSHTLIAVARNGAGLTTTSSPVTVTVNKDSTGPTVTITSPANSAAVSGSLNLTATSTDSSGVAGVKFYYDGTNLIGTEVTATSTPDTYVASWNTASGVTDGTHTLIAVARDTSNNQATSSAVSVTVDNNAPTVPASLSATAVSSSEIDLSWASSSDTVGVAGYHVYRGGALIATTTQTSYPDTGLAASTLFTYAVSAYDGIGNESARTASTSATTQAIPSPGGGGGGGGGAIYPTLSQVTASSLTNSSAVISWLTDLASDSKVDYGLSAAYGLTASSTALAVNHQLVLTDLSSLTTYHFKVSSKVLPFGSPTVSVDYIFTTASSSAPAGASPSPFSIRLVNSKGTYYLIQGSQRYGITSPGILYSYGFEFKDAKPATAGDLSLNSGILLLPGNGYLVKSVQDPTVYLISQGQRHAFVSQAVFKILGFSFENVLIVTNPELQLLNRANNIDNPASAHLPGTDINDNGTIYWITSTGTRQPYPSLAVYNSWHRDNDFSQVVPANGADRGLTVGGTVEKRILE